MNDENNKHVPHGMSGARFKRALTSSAQPFYLMAADAEARNRAAYARQQARNAVRPGGPAHKDVAAPIIDYTKPHGEK